MNPNININNPVIVYEFLGSNLKTKDAKRFERGEVFTPLTIVNRILDKLPEEVWSDPSLRWLDPAVGIGNFMAVVYERLMIGLMNVITNRKKRQRHILEKMLYMAEISPDSIAVLKHIFCSKQYKLNIFEGSFINTDEGIAVYPPHTSFDIVVGNPPYNQGGIMSSKKDVECKLKKKVLWNAFIDKSLELLKDKGYLLFIVPLSWLKSSNKSHNAILTRTLISLELWDASNSYREIDANIPLSIFLLMNTPNIYETPTDIEAKFIRNTGRYISGRYREYLDPLFDIPFAFHSQILKLSRYTYDNMCGLNRQTTKSSLTSINERKQLNKKTDGLIEMSYEDLMNVKAEDNYLIDTYLNTKGCYLVNKLSSPSPEASIHKLILCNKSILTGCIIDKGKFSLSPSSPNVFFTSDNLTLLHKMLGFKLIQILSQTTKYHMTLLNREIGKFIPDLSKMGFDDIEEDAFYDLIGLTEAEKKEISECCECCDTNTPVADTIDA